MADIEQQLRSAMHAAVDGEEAAAGELIRLVRRRHRRHTAWVGSVAAAVIAASVTALFVSLSGGRSAPSACLQARRLVMEARP